MGNGSARLGEHVVKGFNIDDERLKGTNGIDTILTINGIPVVTIELKNPFTGQTYENAIHQYKNDRSPDDLIFAFKKRALVHFAVDPGEAYMTTRIDEAICLYKTKTEEEQDEFRSTLISFRNLYAFLAQIIPFYDSDLEKLYRYLRALQLKLPRRDQSSIIDLEGDVALKYFRLQLISEGSISLTREPRLLYTGRIPSEPGRISPQKRNFPE